MKKQKADKFIQSHVDIYGLVGSNITQNESKFPRLQGSSGLFFSKNNHFQWGYNGTSYSNRRSSSCMYFTNYSKQRNTGSILTLDRSLVDIAEQIQSNYGFFSVINRGRLEDHAFVESCADAGGINFDQTILTYDGQLTYPIDAHIPFTIMDITADLLLNVARTVVPWLRTKSIDVIQDIAIAKAFDDQLVFPSRMNFVNHNHDGGKSCGPANWALCDAEEDTALMRYDWFEEGMTHIIANLATWSPELMASQLNEPALRRCMDSPENNTPNANLATDQMWRGITFIDSPIVELPDWWSDVQDEINTMHDKGKYNEKWFTPLYRVLDGVSVPYIYEVKSESYGTVY